MALRIRCALLAVALVATALVAADQPPRHLKFVNGHWTAWDPPASFPEGARVHIVERGDTFWALAAKNLGNPYLWPQLWEKNQYVLDAHWIYPGDPLVIGVDVAPVAPMESAGLGTGEEGETEEVAGIETAVVSAEPATDAAASGARLRTLPAGGAKSVPVPLSAEDDIYCSGFIGAADEAFAYSITGSEYEVLSPELVNVAGEIEGIYGTVDTVKVQLTTGDIVYLDGGRQGGLSPGMVLTAVEPGARIVHPHSGDTFGRQYNYRGRVRVVSVTDEAGIGEVVQSCLGMQVGTRLRPFVPEPVPLARRTPLRAVNDPTTPEALAGAPIILSSPSRLVTLGQDHVVFIDKGEDDDVLPGDLFTIYRTNREPRPPVVLGELAVLSVQRNSAVAKILESRYPIFVGDRLERK